ncbi:DMT family transporter [Frigidibacter sp. ROC022]|uniref:DMT family transporter n=1 Tax=Frigidibacter sp. ROC022 TaxID=2971796 RepID=UPI00215A4823|nr:DMT family transporter [Frigidibacter sp. ROC022]MCR8726338.1 DMT family transporter [Frigidibacter sp. ROC022]
MARAASLRAAIWMIGSVLSFTLMAVAARKISDGLDTFEIMLYRSVIGLALVLAISALTGTRGQISARKLHLHGLRNIAHFTGQNLWLYAITVAPLAQVFALEFTMPIWAMGLSALVLGEALKARHLGVALVGFLGVLIITRPWLSGLAPGILPAAGAAVCFAGTAVATRLLTRSVSVTAILFWLTVMQATLGLVCAGSDLAIAWPAAAAWPWVAVVAATGLGAHYCMTTALGLAPARVVIPIDFARLPLAALVGYLFYNEPVTTAVFIGAAIIFLANYVNLLIESRDRGRG